MAKRLSPATWVYLPLALLLFALGGYFTWHAFHTEPERAPDLAVAEKADDKLPPQGPRSAQLSGGKVTPESMEHLRLLIPATNVYAPIDEKSGNITAGELTLPEASKVTRWSKGPGVTSKEGNIVIAGHVSWNGKPGALYNLAKVPLGSMAWVTDEKGNRQGFQLVSKVPYKKTSLPSSIWDSKGEKRLTVITCGGKLHLVDGAWHFDSNIVSTWKPLVEKKG